MEKIPTVVFCIPGGTFSNHFLLSWTDTISKIIGLQKYKILVSNHYTSHVHFVRAHCLGADVKSGPLQKPFQGKLDYDVIVWLDSDMVYNYNMIVLTIVVLSLIVTVVSLINTGIFEQFYLGHLVIFCGYCTRAQRVLYTVTETSALIIMRSMSVCVCALHIHTRTYTLCCILPVVKMPKKVTVISV